jgi:DHA1 family bicyclomycin/chloramphenicol resistance-like MFS transporter
VTALDLPSRRGRATPGSREFLLIVATCMGMSAISIDLLLPAFPDMREDFGLAVGSTDVSRVITGYFLGLALGQLLYGPLSDRYGRKPMLYAGMAVFLVGAVGSVAQGSLAGMVACRFVWGFGAAAPRSLAVAVVRDTFEGERMARTMSLIMAIFILVPVFAPTVGAAILAVAPWRAVLWLQVGVAVALVLWSTRLPETLAPEDRRSVSPRSLGEAAVAVVRSRQTVAFGLAVLAIFGMMTSYIGTIEVVVDEVFGQADRFPLIFGALACMLAVGSLFAARVVGRLGLPLLLRLGAAYLLATTIGLALLAAATDGEPPLWAFCVVLAFVLTGVSVLAPSCNTAAMTPLGHVAGMGSAILGTVATAGGAVLGTLTDGAFDGTVGPFAYHVLVYSAVVAAAVFLLAGRPAAAPLDPTDVVGEPLASA